MSDRTKDWLSKWAPLMFALFTNVAVVAYGYGKMSQRLEPLEDYAATHTTEKAIGMFITRSEFVMNNNARDRELADIKAGLTAANDKLDRLIERSKK